MRGALGRGLSLTPWNTPTSSPTLWKPVKILPFAAGTTCHLGLCEPPGRALTAWYGWVFVWRHLGTQCKYVTTGKLHSETPCKQKTVGWGMQVGIGMQADTGVQTGPRSPVSFETADRRCKERGRAARRAVFAPDCSCNARAGPDHRGVISLASRACHWMPLYTGRPGDSLHCFLPSLHLPPKFQGHVPPSKGLEGGKGASGKERRVIVENWEDWQPEVGLCCLSHSGPSRQVLSC